MPKNKKNHFLEAAKALDFYRIRKEIASYAMSAEGRIALLEREPCADANFIRRVKTLSAQWEVYSRAKDFCPITAWNPVEKAIQILGISGARLSAAQLSDLANFASIANRTFSSIYNVSFYNSLQDLKALCQNIPSLKEAEQKITAVIDVATRDLREVGALKDAIKRIQNLKAEVQKTLHSYTASASYAQVLQENVPVYRAGRELLAVRTDHMGAIRGIVHTLSPSGQTAYIEPEDVVKANNALVEAEYALEALKSSMLLELTASLAPFAKDFAVTLKELVALDGIQAGVAWKNAVGGVFCLESSAREESLCLLEARHPLLGKKAVPLSIRLMRGKNVLIISGPNTGGKTVALKTVALFALLNQAGFPVPCAEGSALPLFDAVFCDIGDSQSIDSSLSTFSAHMKKLSEMLSQADSRSLVLLDEFASGTDTLEGGAIAMASLDEFIHRGATVLVTTHHAALKQYGYTNEQCVNASVEFDTSTLLPSYRLVMGLPGESHALEIAKSTGLLQSVLDGATRYIGTREADVSHLIQALSKKYADVDNLMRSEQEKMQALTKKEEKLRQKEERLKERELSVMQKELQADSAFVRKTRSDLERLVRTLREGEMTREKTLATHEFIKELGETLSQKEQNVERLKAESAEQEEKPQPRDFSPGDSVYYGKEKAIRKGTLLQKNKDGTWQALFGSLKMNVKQEELLIAPKDERATASVVIETSTEQNEDKPQFELRLLGMREKEALSALEKQLDLCAMHNFNSFSVIHGKGNGILQKAVHVYLSHYPGVKEFCFASPEDGGSGKTYVTLF